MSVCLFVCLFVAKDLANCWTDQVLLYRVALFIITTNHLFISVMMDFEIAERNAWKLKWPNHNVLGCLFHFTQVSVVWLLYIFLIAMLLYSSVCVAIMYFFISFSIAMLLYNSLVHIFYISLTVLIAMLLYLSVHYTILYFLGCVAFYQYQQRYSFDG